VGGIQVGFSSWLGGSQSQDPQEYSGGVKSTILSQDGGCFDNQ
jgi:hypothetical protein